MGNSIATCIDCGPYTAKRGDAHRGTERNQYLNYSDLPEIVR